MDIKRLEGEDFIAYTKRITQGKDDKTLDIDYVEWGMALIDEEYSSENFRKCFYFMKKYLEKVDKEYFKNFTEDDLIREIEQKKIELQKEKIKFQNQRTAFNKLIRERARQEELNDLLVNAVNNNLTKLNYIHKEFIPTDNDLMVSLNDIHYGANISNMSTEYNSDICRDMFEEYLNRILEIKKIHNSQNCYVCANGDLINGDIRRTVSLENKENIIEQIMGVSELISDFLYELSLHFDKVVFSSVSGNHSRTQTKDDATKEERLDNLIEWYVEARLNNIKNVIINKDKPDTTFYILNIRGKNYIGCHGDYDNSNYKIQSLVQMANKPVYGVLLGHLHHNTTDYVQGIKTLMAGSFLGINDYCLEKRIIGQPQQMVCVCNNDGVLCHYDINFKN